MSVAARKTRFLVHELRRLVVRTRISGAAYLNNPPVIANSFPKSETHLLLGLITGYALQVAAALGGEG